MVTLVEHLKGAADPKYRRIRASGCSKELYYKSPKPSALNSIGIVGLQTQRAEGSDNVGA